jgi:hypothetical protein
MFIYNVTVNVSEEIHEQWLIWMRERHIPDVMRTGCFTSHRILKVLHVHDEGHTYSIQYLFNEMSEIERYQKEFAKKLQDEHRHEFGDRYTAFRTLLEVVSD